ncbi:probable ATP-dependent RNA helicase DDX10 [Centruroides sculpturatus]|uniref:probable ATP-dependent RNA helicase DDX10 n=1 Tax=Centruroides sculpturatus TaxID=218467 RepID=UPI000C6D9A74|nr:probable ATP-dependent RNA helicase DDX10 [Centruroides sculpturatus]
MATCKQVKYTYETFCRMRPGMTVMALYGSLHQLRRMSIYDEFCRKQHAVLFATDIAARGLDFPSVNWVIQLDCPEDVKTYIHRVGRTARYEGNGEALLVLLPSEKSMAQQLIENKIPIEEISINKKKFMSVQKKIEVLCSRDHVLKESAQRAFVSYLKNVFLMKDKNVFNIKQLDTEAYSRSLGLAVAPRIRFLSKHQKKLANSKKDTENVDMTTDELKDLMLHSDSEEENAHYEENLNKPLSQTAFNFHGEESDDDVLIPKQNKEESDHEIEAMDELISKSKEQKPLTKSAVAKKLLKKKVKPNKKITYDDEGQPVNTFPSEQKSEFAQELKKESTSFDLELARKIMEEEDKIDKQLFKERVRALHKEKKMKLKEERRALKEKGFSSKKDDNNEFKENDDYEDEVLENYIDALPNPDRVNDNNEDDKDDYDNEDEETVINMNSRKLSPKEKKNPKRSSCQGDSDDGGGRPGRKKKKMEERSSEPADTGLSLGEDEELALHLLTH